MRTMLTLVHRWAGLAIAGFLFVSGLTGAVISWDHELDDLLNARLTHVASRGPARPSLDLAREIEARDPRIRVTSVPLVVEPGASLNFGVEPRVDPSTRRLYEPGYNEVFLDPVTGQELGRREWGAAWPITRETFVSFLYILHYSLHVPEMWGTDHWGLWLLGGVALIWTFDCFVGFALTLPARRVRQAPVSRGAALRGWWVRWKPAWLIKTSTGAYRVTFDLHRASGLWTWALLFTIAFTGFSLNLYTEIFFPVMTKVSSVTPSPYDLRTETDRHQPIEPRIAYPAIIEQARAEGRRRGWAAPPGVAYYSQNYGIYGVSFYQPGDDHGAAGVGSPELYYDALDGRLLGDFRPWSGTAADLFLQAQFPLHSGRILGLPGRILISLMGLVVATLSVTGVVIWYRKRLGRQARAHRRASVTGDAVTHPPSVTPARASHAR